MKLSNQEKRELDKFTKFLALKCTQIIVQSRLGDKISTLCRAQTTGTDWFNLNISDLPEVLAETKRVLNGEIISSNVPLCVEISLRTTEGDHMVLENWCLGMLPEQCDPTTRIVHTIYNRMGTLLKSLVSITRAVPAYKLSRRQGPDSFVICYRIFLGEPMVRCLGEDFNQVKIGQICTPIGTLNLSVSYRTKMTISPTQTGRQNSIMLKSDHFNAKLSPKSRKHKQNEDKIQSLGNTMKTGAFADMQKKKIESLFIVPNTPFSGLFKDPSKGPDRPQEDNMADRENNENESPERNGNSAIDNNPPTKLNSLTMVSTNDDFIMVDLKTPFASTNEKSELGKFYREWQAAPPLQTFVEELSPLDELDVTKQLETFESDLNEFDTVVQSLCRSAIN
ncbi:unnamed protein product [Phyllotreta striolata]|uniref:Autophagy-related protein 13 n=1 Tax=Phyllotreta striolata TaxID=444603 RepID=A0A9N9TYC8_PHYSR|nr:unnamed protein product [Phyllotreta striolata]